MESTYAIKILSNCIKQYFGNALGAGITDLRNLEGSNIAEV